ncbi:hypothetical protein JOQ06_025919, partial [Pogonophryne albipinna]
METDALRNKARARNEFLSGTPNREYSRAGVACVSLTCNCPTPVPHLNASHSIGGAATIHGGVRETFGPGFVGKFGSGASFFEEEIKGLCQNQTRETAWTCPRVSCIHTSRLST